MKFQISELTPPKIKKLLAATKVSVIFGIMPSHGNLQKKQPDLQALPKITFRQLEIFRTVCHEKSFANAAIELGTTRPHIKRSCEEFEQAVGRKLFGEARDRTLLATEFAQELLRQIGPLSRGLRHLEDGVRALHQSGRVLRLAAAGEFFRGGLFTDFLARVRLNDTFRPCFLRIDPARFRNALLNAECDVYFGVGLQPSDRMDLVDLGPIPWKIEDDGKRAGHLPTTPSALRKAPWFIAAYGEAGAASAALDAIHAAGAQGGAVLADDQTAPGIVLHPDTTAPQCEAAESGWPGYRFTAVLRKHHPYPDLKSRLAAAALI